VHTDRARLRREYEQQREFERTMKRKLQAIEKTAEDAEKLEKLEKFLKAGDKN